MSEALCLRCLISTEDFPPAQHRRSVQASGSADHPDCKWLDIEGVTAVVSSIDTASYCEKNLQSLPWLTREAQRHAGIIESYFQQVTTLPVKFGAIFSSRAVLRSHLSERRELVQQALTRLQGQAEWDIRILASEAKMEAVAIEGGFVSEDRVAVAASGEGLSYLLRRRREQQLQHAVQTARASLRREISDRLSSWSLHRKATSDRLPERDGLRLVDHVCAMLPAADYPRLEQSLVTLQEAHADCLLKVELSGPWPPYHFCPDFRAS
jgi:C4-dicarboxylate-specific signal transduction histidine kinase